MTPSSRLERLVLIPAGLVLFIELAHFSGILPHRSLLGIGAIVLSLACSSLEVFMLLVLAARLFTRRMAFGKRSAVLLSAAGLGAVPVLFVIWRVSMLP